MIARGGVVGLWACGRPELGLLALWRRAGGLVVRGEAQMGPLAAGGWRAGVPGARGRGRGADRCGSGGCRGELVDGLLARRSLHHHCRALRIQVNPLMRRASVFAEEFHQCPDVRHVPNVVAQRAS